MGSKMRRISQIASGPTCSLIRHRTSWVKLPSSRGPPPVYPCRQSSQPDLPTEALNPFHPILLGVTDLHPSI